MLSLRDPKDRYPVDLKLANGATKVSLQGTLLEPLKFGGAELKLELAGDDLSALYPLTGIPLAPTPPYHLGGQLDYEGHKVRFRNFAGGVGSSDLAGNIEVQLGGVRPYFRADMESKRVVLADLRGFIGAAPGKDNAANLSQSQQQEHDKQDASGKLLPDKPINLPKLRSVDFDVHYKGEHIESESTPLDNLVANLKVEDGALSLQPLSFGVGTGAIVLNLKLDGQQDLVHAVADIDFRKVDLSRIMQSTGVFKGAGTIGGSAKLDTTGNSLAQMLGHGDGEMKLFMSGGDLSAVLVDLAGLDFGNTLIAALGIPHQAQLRCMVSDFDLNKGVLDTRTLIFDTSAANVIGSGTVNLRDEQVDYKLSTQPKRFSIGSLAAPILIRGPLKNPSIHPDPLVLGARAGAAVALGVFLTPLAALLPTIQLGLGKDHNCDELLATVQTAAKIPARTARRKRGLTLAPPHDHRRHLHRVRRHQFQGDMRGDAPVQQPAQQAATAQGEGAEGQRQAVAGSQRREQAADQGAATASATSPSVSKRSRRARWESGRASAGSAWGRPARRPCRRRRSAARTRARPAPGSCSAAGPGRRR